MFMRWITHPAEWWQFWYPQSGIFGGIIVFYALVFAGCMMIGMSP